MNFNPKHEQDETAIELTPLIDVVFLLLIFFMISTTFTKETSLKINLPDAKQEPKKTKQPPRVEIHIGAESEYAIGAEGDGKAKALINSNRETLVRGLSEFKNNKKLLLVIRADKNAPHQAVVKVLDVAQQLGMTNVTFATKQAL